MKKMLILGAVIMMTLAGGCSKEDKAAPAKTVFDLQQITFEELDKELTNKGSMVVYFGWIENCTDSKNFQKNYLNKHLNSDQDFQAIKVVNLDKELPDALETRDERAGIKAKYDVEYSPTLVYYIDGKAVSKLEWTPDTTDKKTGIMKSRLDEFFKDCGYLD